MSMAIPVQQILVAIADSRSLGYDNRPSKESKSQRIYQFQMGDFIFHGVHKAVGYNVGAGVTAVSIHMLVIGLSKDDDHFEGIL